MRLPLRPPLLLVVSLLIGPAVQAEQQTVPAGDNIIVRGEYLARAGDCIACHTAPEGRMFAGGRAMPTPFGTLYSSNITPDPETGIGRWSADDFYRTMHNGRFPDGGLIYPAMPFASYTKVTRGDTDAIFAYLKSIPPVTQKNRRHERCFSAKANTRPPRENLPNGIAAPISSKDSAIAGCAIRPSTRLAEPRSPRRSRAA